MANVTIPPTGTGTATPVIATDTVAGVEYQKIKVDVGAAGATSLVTAANPLPVVQTGTPALPTGAATETTLDTRTGALTEAAPASDTASSGINGRLQRIAQRLTSLIAVFSIGAGTEAAAVRVTLPTDGTGKVNAAQSGTWTVQPGNTANSTAWKVDGSAVTQPVSGTVTANAGTNLNTSLLSTAAKQPALGTAGTASTDVITVQGIAAGTPLPIGGKQTRISVTPTVSTSPAYTAKDAVGGLLTFANAARVSGGTITIQTVVINDNSQQMPALDLVLFDRTFTASTDNAIFAPSDADLLNTIGTIPVSNWADFSTNSSATRPSIGLAAKLNGTDLFGQLVTRSTPTFVATSDIVVIVEVLQD